MTRASARHLLAACLLSGALLPLSFAHAEETLVWTTNTNGDLISLTYGSLDTSKPPVLLLSCFNEMDVAVLEIFGTIEGTRPGQKISIDFAAGSTQSSIDGAVELDDKTGLMFAEASEVKLADGAFSAQIGRAADGQDGRYHAHAAGGWPRRGGREVQQRLPGELAGACRVRRGG